MKCVIRKQCSNHIRDLARTRRYLSKSVTITLANALVSSLLDYCNSLLYGITSLELQRLQDIQNTLCRIITRTSRYSSVRDHLKLLHWLPVKYRIEFIELIVLKLEGKNKWISFRIALFYRNIHFSWMSAKWK